VRADLLAAGLPRRSWQRLSAGAGTKGHRYYRWAWFKIDDDQPGQHWLLVRRNDSTGEMAHYRCYSPRPTPLIVLVRVAGQRWKIEESFHTANGQAGLDEHQVRRRCSRHRRSTLAMLAMAFLAVTTADEPDRHPAPTGLIPMTLNELHRLLDALVIAATATIQDVLKWSTWRRRHQARAQQCHYHRKSQHLKPDLRAVVLANRGSQIHRHSRPSAGPCHWVARTPFDPSAPDADHISAAALDVLKRFVQYTSAWPLGTTAQPASGRTSPTAGRRRPSECSLVRRAFRPAYQPCQWRHVQLNIQTSAAEIAY